MVFERSGYVSYANCGLPYYVGGVITDPGELTLQTPESFYSRFHIDVRVRHEVTAIHPERKTVSVCNLETRQIWEESYDKLLLSPGAHPVQPKLPGVGIKKVFTLRTVEDTFRIREFGKKIIRSPWFWQAAASSVWSWQRICGNWAWTSQSCSGRCR